MRALHVTPSFYPALIYGGPMRSVYHLCRYLAQKQCTVRVLTTNANGPDSVLPVSTKSEIELSEGFTVYYCNRILPDSVSPQLVRLLPEYLRWANVVHLMAVYSFPIIPTLLLSRLLGKPVVWSPRGMLQRWEGSTNVRLKQIWEVVCRIVSPKNLILHVTSEQEAKESQERMPNATISVIPNSVEIPAFVGHASAKGIRFLYLGRLHPKKGIDNLLDAYKMLVDHRHKDSTLTIAGAGDSAYAQQIQSKIELLDLSARVRMIGPVKEEEKGKVFENADVVVVPSHTENFGMVVAEALAHEVPVIASKGTPWSRIQEKGCGLWVENDPESLAGAIERICAMPLREMGKRGREWMEQDFAGAVVAEKMMDLYTQTMARS